MSWEVLLSKDVSKLDITDQTSNTDSKITFQGTAKAALKAAGYNGPIATVDTMSKHAFRGSPSHLGPHFDSSEISQENVLIKV